MCKKNRCGRPLLPLPYLFSSRLSKVKEREPGIKLIIIIMIKIMIMIMIIIILTIKMMMILFCLQHFGFNPSLLKLKQDSCPDIHRSRANSRVSVVSVMFLIHIIFTEDEVVQTSS